MNVRALKHFCEGPPQYGLNTPASEYVHDGVRFVRTTDINDDGSIADDSAVYVSPSLVSPEYELRPGDLLLSRSGSLGRCLRFTTEIGPATFAGYLVRFRPKPDVEPRYLEYCTRAAAFQQTIEAEAISSTISNFNAERYANLGVPWWPLERQRAIADYLDTETNRIDALITKKRRMIEVLDERRRVAIDRSVTRGLDADVAFKDSGLEFAQEIPCHWDKVPLSSVCSFQAGKAHEPFIDDDGEFICVNSRFISTEGQTVKRCTRNLSPGKRSDILMVMSDLPNGRALAKAFFVDEDEVYAVNQRVCIISPQGIDPRFAFYQLNRNPFFLRYDDGSNQTHLANSVFTKFPLLLPPAQEQRAIAAFLDDLTASIGAASRLLSQQIDRLAEHRQALITAAVSGEMKVPGAAA